MPLVRRAILIAATAAGNGRDRLPTRQWDDDSLAYGLGTELGLGVAEAQERLDVLAALLPDVATRLTRTSMQVLAEFCQDLPGLAMLLLELKEELPSLNISLLMSRHPSLLLGFRQQPGALRGRLDEMRRQLGPRVNVAALVAAEPFMLTADMPAVLASCARLMPGMDPIPLLVSMPHMLLSAADSGLPPAPDVEGSPSLLSSQPNS